MGTLREAACDRDWREWPQLTSFSSPLAREGADGQAVVCPLLRGSSPTRGVAPKQHRGLGRAFTPAFRAGSLSLNPLARGCRRICRGEIWKYGFGRRDATERLRRQRHRQILDLLISSPCVNLFHHPQRAREGFSTRAREGAARPAVPVCPLLRGSSPTRRGRRPNSIGGSGVLSLRHFGLVLFIPHNPPGARGRRRICRGERWFRPRRDATERLPAAPSPI